MTKSLDDRAGEIDQAKRTLRKSCATARDALPLEVRAASAERIAALGLAFSGPRPGATVSVYAAMSSEIDPATLLARLAGEGYATCLPVIQPLGNPLKFCAWMPGEPLVTRTWGIREPTEAAPEVEPDVLLVPLLAFDRRGFRLGYGGGYYDRTLQRLRAMKPLIAIGLAFSEQELASLPCDRHDQRLDWILTPDGPIEAVAP